MSGIGEAATPLMQQYREIKTRHQNALLFFRMASSTRCSTTTPRLRREYSGSP